MVETRTVALRMVETRTVALRGVVGTGAGWKGDAPRELV